MIVGDKAAGVITPWVADVEKGEQFLELEGQGWRVTKLEKI